MPNRLHKPAMSPHIEHAEPLVHRRESRERSHGTGMPRKLRHGLEALSGMDLSGVRIYRDSPRPLALDALAYTQGREIHLAPGQERQLPHEGWHAVQQLQGRVAPTSRAHGIPINEGDTLEREADVMGARALAGTNLPAHQPAHRRVPHIPADPRAFPARPGRPVAVAQRKQGKRSARRDTRDAIEAQRIFWTDVRTSTEPGVDEFRNAITASSYEADQPELVKTINPTTRLEVRLNKQFLKETDATVRLQAIDTEVRIFKQALDASKAAEAARLARIEAAKASIASAFKLSGVVDGDADWTESELAELEAALNMLPAADKPALEGAEIRRVTSLGKTTAGRFTYDFGGVNPGDTAVSHSATMELADRAFSGGSPAATRRVIVHEVGHAIAGEKLQKARVAHGEATIEQNLKGVETTDSFNRLSAANVELQAAIDAYKDKDKEYKAETDPTRKATLKAERTSLYAEYKKKRAVSSKLLEENKADAADETKAKETTASKEAAVAALEISPGSLAAIQASADSARQAHDTKLSAAKTAAATLDQSDSAIKSYHDAVLQVSTDVEALHNDTKGQDKTEKQVEALIKTVDKSIRGRDAAMSALVSGKKGADMIAALADLEAAQAVLFEAAKKHALAHKRNKKVHEFAKFVEANKIAPITPYAAENWPHKPEEFYAEAYSFWVTGKLAGASADLDKWFNDGKYK